MFSNLVFIFNTLRNDWYFLICMVHNLCISLMLDLRSFFIFIINNISKNILEEKHMCT